MTKVDQSRAWVVVPAYNEAQCLGRVLAELQDYTDNIIVVDDGSLDQTRHQAELYTNHVLSHPVNLGKGAALKTGFEYAFNIMKAHGVISIDADGQHAPADLPKFLEALAAGHEVVWGVRDLDAMPKSRKFINIFDSWLIKVLFNRFIPDIPSGYQALTKKAYDQLKWQSRDYAVEMELAMRLAKTGLAYHPVSIKTHYFVKHSAMNALDAGRVLYQVLYWRMRS